MPNVQVFLRNVLNDACVYTEFAKRKVTNAHRLQSHLIVFLTQPFLRLQTVHASDVTHALARQGRTQTI